MFISYDVSLTNFQQFEIQLFNVTVRLIRVGSIHKHTTFATIFSFINLSAEILIN